MLLEHRTDAGDEAKLRRKSAATARSGRASESVASEGLKAVLLATPPDVSMDLTPKFLDAGGAVIDLSGAFRLRTPERYKQWYKEDHTAPAVLTAAALNCRNLTGECRNGPKRLISKPGCYPTAANLALRPLAAAGVIDRSAGIVCDAKSGVSGAGRKPALKTSFCEVTENFPVSILKHRHVAKLLLTSELEEREFSLLAAAHRSRYSRRLFYFRLARPLSETGSLRSTRSSMPTSLLSGFMNQGRFPICAV